MKTIAAPVDTLPWASYNRLPSQPAGFPLQVLRPCPLTGAQSEEIELFRLDDFQCFDDRDGRNRMTHRVVFNPESGLVYTNPAYTPEGFAFLFDKAGQSYGHSPGRMEEQANWLLKHCPDIQSVWDIGCGYGAFLRALPSRLSRTGIDIDPPSIERAKAENPDLEFYCSDFTTFSLPGVPDMMTMFHVLEHLPQPLQTLQGLRRLAADHTRLLVEVPVLDRVAKEPSQDLVGFFSVQHLTHFSHATLQAILRQAGWEIVQQEIITDYNGYRVIARPCEPDMSPIPPDRRERDLAMAKQYVDYWHSNTQRVRDRIEASLGNTQNILIWGGGQHTEYLAQLTGLFQENRQFCIVDMDPLKTGTTLHDIPILHPDQLSAEVWENPAFKILVSTYRQQPNVLAALSDKNVPMDAVITLYDSVDIY